MNSNTFISRVSELTPNKCCHDHFVASDEQQHFHLNSWRTHTKQMLPRSFLTPLTITMLTPLTLMTLTPLTALKTQIGLLTSANSHFLNLRAPAGVCGRTPWRRRILEIEFPLTPLTITMLTPLTLMMMTLTPLNPPTTLLPNFFSRLSFTSTIQSYPTFFAPCIEQLKFSC